MSNACATVRSTPNKGFGKLTKLDSLEYSCEVRIRPEDQGGFSAYVARLAGAHGQGDTIKETKEDITSALHDVLSQYIEDEQPIPWREPLSVQQYEERHWVIVNV